MTGSFVTIILGIILVLLGLISIFAKDLAWEMTEWYNRGRGVQSERTSHWETTSTLGGAISIAAGFICFWAATFI